MTVTTRRRDRRSHWPHWAWRRAPCARRRPPPVGAADRRRAHHAGADLARSGGDSGDHHAVHGAVRAARRGGEADAARQSGAVAGGILVGRRGRAELRVRPAQGCEVPQWRPGHRRRCEILVRALSRRGAWAAEGAGGGGGDARSAARRLQVEDTVAGFHYVLCRCLGRRLGRAAQVRGEGRRGRFQEGPDRRRTLQIRLVHPRRRTGAGGIRPVPGERRRA